MFPRRANHLPRGLKHARFLVSLQGDPKSLARQQARANKHQQNQQSVDAII
jgi:hypothetical protein